MGYLFVCFTGEQPDGEQIYFSVSKDGRKWEDLNQGNPVLRSGIGEKGVRDPFLVRHPRTNRYYLMATDLCIHAGKSWEEAQTHGSRDLIVWESDDLIHWSKERSCTVGVPQAGCVWAPEAIYDEERQAFFVFFASRICLPGDRQGKHRIYATYTEDFRTFSDPFVYMDRETDVIDTTIIQTQGMFYRFSKDETHKRILLEKSKHLLGDFTPIDSELLKNLKGVEGPEIYLLPDQRTWCLILDHFQEKKGYLPLLTDNLDSGIFQTAKEGVWDPGEKKKRHGGVLCIGAEDYERLRNNYL